MSKTLLYSQKRRNFLLLEVLIAISLIIIALLPIISPNLFIARERREFINKIDLDHVASLLYASINEQLYQNRILWDDIVNSTVFPLSSENLAQYLGRRRAFPYEGVYYFVVQKYKPKDDEEIQKQRNKAYLIRLMMKFRPLQFGKSEEIEYKFFLKRKETPLEELEEEA